MSESTAGEVASTGVDLPVGTGEPSSTGVLETGSVGPMFALLWTTDLTMGSFAMTKDDECAAALEGSEDLCAEPPFEIVGRAKAPLISLPQLHPFLEEAEFVSARTGEFVLANFAELLEGRVEPEFLDALLPDGDQLSMYAWRGPVDRVEDSCADWTVSTGSAPAWYFELGSEAASLDVSAPCMSQLRVLCTCPANP